MNSEPVVLELLNQYIMENSDAKKSLLTRRRISLALGLGIIVSALVIYGGCAAMSKPPATLGLTDGKLSPCPKSPNCVCSQDPDTEKLIEPFAFEGEPADAMSTLVAVVEAFPRTTIITQNDDYLHAEFRTAVFRFIDDVEFLLDPDGSVIHVRSASRLGHSDMGVNRKRVEQLRSDLSVAFSNTN
jgi:uncharacterized protein (DUF1499 family)